MQRLELDHGTGTFVLDLGDITDDLGPDGGDLDAYGGNLYIKIDGQEFGSLFFWRDPLGNLRVTLGHFNTTTQEWEPGNDLQAPHYSPDPTVS